MKKDSVIFDIIEKERQRQLKGIELIASENFVSDQVMQAMGSCLTNKYAEGYPGHRYYGGCEVVDQSETIAIERLKKLFNTALHKINPEGAMNMLFYKTLHIYGKGWTIACAGYIHISVYHSRSTRNVAIVAS